MLNISSRPDDVRDPFTLPEPCPCGSPWGTLANEAGAVALCSSCPTTLDRHDAPTSGQPPDESQEVPDSAVAGETNTAALTPQKKKTTRGKARKSKNPMKADRQITSPLKWHGGKHYLARRFINLMPPHHHYVEPYFGGGAVLFAKNPIGVSEVVNDIYNEVTDFFRVFQSDADVQEFLRIMQFMPFSQAEFEKACETPGNTRVERAVSFLVRNRQSHSGRMKEFAAISRNRIRRDMNEQTSAWMTAVEGLPEVVARLKRVVILNDDALNVIRRQDSPNTLFYCDPPYLHETRKSTDVYDFEMTEDDHRRLLELLNKVKGAVLLSGYRSDLYDSMLQPPKWERFEFDVPNNAAGGAKKKRMKECIWRKMRDPVQSKTVKKR